MLRKTVPERENWEQIARDSGFHFHHVGGERYWDEGACWVFSLDEVENRIEDPSAELYALCLSLVDEAVGSQELMEQLAIPDDMRDLVADSWRRGDPSLYGRFDLAYDGSGPAKLLEFNADTPTSIYETAFFQWNWLDDMVEAGEFPDTVDQYNSLHEALIARFGEIFEQGSLLHFSGDPNHIEDRSTVLYLEDLAGQAGLETRFVDIERIGLTETGAFVDPEGWQLGAVFKLYPWEDMMREAFAQHIARSGTLFVEPPWKAILSNKAMLPLLWARHADHPNLLPAFFSDSKNAASLADRPHVVKPFFSREGADIALFDGAENHRGPEEGYGAEGSIIQGFAPLARSGENHAVIGSWIVGDTPVAMSIREDASPITRDLARFVPHVIMDS